MKKLYCLLLIASYCSMTTVKAQPACSGVYLTANDFIVGKLYYASACRRTSKDSYYRLLANSHFFIIQPGWAWRRIDKENVFAIKSCEGQIIRIYQGNNFYLLNPGEPIPIYKTVANAVSKGSIIRVKYCFSTDIISEIRDLTIDNLKAAFPQKDHFAETINAHFKDDSDLYAYNQINKCFELNEVYSMCK